MPLRNDVLQSPQASPKLWLLCGLAFVGVGVYARPTQGQKIGPEAVQLFESKVRPTLLAKCVSCHGEKQQLGDVRLDKAISADTAKALVSAIAYDGDIKMPPSGKLPKDELSALTSWAKAGAPWPAATDHAKSKEKFWAFVTPIQPPLPKVKDKAWIQSPIDQFVLAQLEEKGLKPMPPADKRTLIRRATFDLTGIPPTPKEIDDFLADRSPKAFEKIVDRLLTSPAYGERWGRHWLDVARYADSNGLDENLVYVNAWHYRDWVIDAMNADKPINRFIQEQIAGDLMPDAGDGGVVATGYLALGAKMLAEDDPAKQELDIIDEQVDTLGKSILGLTVGCARCHDHKFDPIPAKDYYAMAGIFKSTKTMENFKVVADWYERPIGPKADIEKYNALQAQIQAKEKEAQGIRDKENKRVLDELLKKAPAYESGAKAHLAQEQLKPKLKPVVIGANGVIPKGSITLEAEDFVSGNVKVDRTNFGKGIGVILNNGVQPNLAIYNVTVPTAGTYQVDLRFASGENRPARLYANNQLALAYVAGDNTGGFLPANQIWTAEGDIPLRAGQNQLMLERDGDFPHFDKILLTPKPNEVALPLPGASFPDGNPAPQVLIDLAEKMKNKAPAKIELPEKPESLYSLTARQELKDFANFEGQLKKAEPKIAHTMAVGDRKPTDLKVHLRGSYLTLGENCPRGFLSVLARANQPTIAPDHSGRLELAHWLTSADNPLTARVFVNRVWRWKFGRGLVGSVDNFGALGDLPTHPELLDYLATTFETEDGWSLKKLQRRLMLSSTYQMSTKYDSKAADADPDNKLLWRFNRQRLEAEEIRDSIFFVAGKLDRTMGGSLLKFSPRAYVTSTESKDTIDYDVPRRAVYLPVVRAAVYDVYTAFDFGDPTVMNGDRPSTTVAPQALFMLNSSIVMKATKALAENLLKSPGLTDTQRIENLYVTLYSRPPTPAELSRSLDYLSKFESAYKNAKATDPHFSAWQSLCKSSIAANEFIYVE